MITWLDWWNKKQAENKFLRVTVIWLFFFSLVPSTPKTKLMNFPFFLLWLFAAVPLVPSNACVLSWLQFLFTCNMFVFLSPNPLASIDVCYGCFGARQVLQLTSWLLLLKVGESQVLFPFSTVQLLIFLCLTSTWQLISVKLQGTWCLRPLLLSNLAEICLPDLNLSVWQGCWTDSMNI